MVLHMEIPIIAMSGNPQSLLAKYSTYHLNVSVTKEACPLNLAPTSSTTATLVMGDALAVALMERRHFQPQDFAQFHPGGELGKRLLTTAQDVMLTENLPTMTADMHLGQAIILVSKGKLGLGVAVSDEKLADCGASLFYREQDTHAGGSGCGCVASVSCGWLMKRLERGELNRVLIVGSGAMFSPTSSQQAQSIPFRSCAPAS